MISGLAAVHLGLPALADLVEALLRVSECHHLLLGAELLQLSVQDLQEVFSVVDSGNVDETRLLQCFAVVFDCEHLVQRNLASNRTHPDPFFWGGGLDRLERLCSPGLSLTR